MSDLTLRKCNICLSEYIPLDRVVFFQCGHYACTPCSERRSYRNDPSCAECRKPKGLPHRIYLSADDLVDESPAHIIHSLNEIDADNSAEKIASVGEKLRRLNGIDKGNSDISRAVLDAAKDLEERVAPLAALYDEAKKQNQELLNRLHYLESTSAAFKSEALRANGIAGLHRDEELRLRERSKGYISIIKEKNLEIERLTMQLNDRDKRERLMKTKLKALARTKSHEAREMYHAGDTSLQVLAKPVSPSTVRPAVLQNLNSPLAKPVKKRRCISDLPVSAIE